MAFAVILMKHSAPLHPLFAIAALTLLLAACSGSTNTTAEVPMIPSEPTASSTSSVPSTSSTPAETAVVPKKYKNGTYSATGNYRSPAGAESVQISLTLVDGVITDATFKGDATAPRSVQMQGQFSSAFKEQVVGKSIDELSLGVVNGSSLTPKGFMDAVAKIQAEASAS